MVGVRCGTAGVRSGIVGEVWDRDGVGCEVRCGMRDGVPLVER